MTPTKITDADRSLVKRVFYEDRFIGEQEFTQLIADHRAAALEEAREEWKTDWSELAVMKQLKDALAAKDAECEQWKTCAKNVDQKMLHEQADHNKTVDRLIAMKAENATLRKDLKLLEHKIITCGVAASHPDANLSRTLAYAAEWNSPQAEEVRVLRDENATLTEEVAKLREALEAITRRVPIMGSMDDYRAGQFHALEACSEVARKALSP